MSGLAPRPCPRWAAKAHASMERRGRDGARLQSLGMVASGVQHRRKCSGQPTSTHLAVRRAGGEFVRLDSQPMSSSRPTNFNRIGTSYSSLCGTVVRIEIERATGALRIAQTLAACWRCGEVLVPLRSMLGQAQGGFAMGVRLCAALESLPLYEDGPGSGNGTSDNTLSREARTCLLHSLQIEDLTCRPSTRTSGQRESARKSPMIPVVPALLNAIFDATGRRFWSLPVTQVMLEEGQQHRRVALKNDVALPSCPSTPASTARTRCATI